MLDWYSTIWVREALGPILLGLAVFLSLLALAVVLRRIIRRLLSRTQLTHSVVALVSQSVFYLLLLLALVTGLGTMGINITALVAGLGLGGFALGFALRDAVSNLLAGVLILVYRPFGPGDRISVAGFEGEVMEINLRYTVLQATEQHHLIPNQMLFTNPVRVWNRRVETPAVSG